jgi:1-deoxy-D-xylulose 5-phosphate reductoisomerase
VREQPKILENQDKKLDVPEIVSIHFGFADFERFKILKNIMDLIEDGKKLSESKFHAEDAKK